MNNGGYPGAGGGGNQANDAAAAVAQQFYDALVAEDTKAMAELFSSKATGKAKSFRDGKPSEEVITEMKTALGSVKFSSSKVVKGMHVVLWDEGGGNQQAQPANGSERRSQRKPGKKVQFQVVSEGGKLVIKEIRIMDH